MQEFCIRCNRVTPSVTRSHASGTEYLCSICGNQVDFEIDDDYEDDDSEPVGSCDRCGVNIYRDEDDGSGLCDLCQFRARLAGRCCKPSNEDYWEELL
jgi:DNA-directed RNA polymerase subunit RPC12/RpoP